MTTPRKRLLWICFALVVALQLGTASWLILRWERILTAGEVIKLECQPVDPLDVFRGRYVELNVKRQEVPGPTDNPLRYHETVFASYEVGPDQFATFTGLSRTRPEKGSYLKCRASNGHRSYGEMMYFPEFPFTRYFMNERLAPHAEDAFLQVGGSRPGVLQIRVLNGRAVLEEVYVGDTPLKDLAREMLEAERDV